MGPPGVPRQSWSPVRLAPMQNGIDLNRAIVCPSEEDSPAADPETKLGSCLYSLDVANACSGVLIDAGNDSASCGCVHPS